MKAIFLTILFVLYGAVAIAAPSPVKLNTIPQESHIKFQVMQGKSEVKGEFKNFTADINFHPEALAASHVKVTIDISSLTVGDAETDGTIKSKDWFDTAAFPQAVFESSSFKSLGDKKYEAIGNLTIKGHSEPTTLTFTLNEFTSTAASISGTAQLKRKTFGIGDPKNDSVKDDVSVAVEVKAVAAK